MAYILPNLSPTLLQPKDKPSAILLPLSSLPTSTTLPQTKLEPPPPRGLAQANRTPGAQDKQQDQRNDFYVNLGLAVRTLREDLPLIFTKDLNYEIYRYVHCVSRFNFMKLEDFRLLISLAIWLRWQGWCDVHWSSKHLHRDREVQTDILGVEVSWENSV